MKPIPSWVKTPTDFISHLGQVIEEQQAEIEALKKEAALQRLSDFTQEADNEPVAWMLLGLEDRKPKLINLQVIEHLEGTWIPLYTHPAKTLTDEEIIKVYENMLGVASARSSAIDFARAILRKAQE